MSTDRRRAANGASLTERLALHSDVDASTGCWIWSAAVNNAGYPLLTTPGGGCRKQLAHRCSYELANGPIPDGLTLDHLCRTPRCINPEHLEAVTLAENVQRARAWRRAATRCPEGHEYTDTWSRCRHCPPPARSTGSLAAAGVVSREVRKWAWAHGVTCPARGRLPFAVLDAYFAATEARAA